MFIFILLYHLFGMIFGEKMSATFFQVHQHITILTNWVFCQKVLAHSKFSQEQFSFSLRSTFAYRNMLQQIPGQGALHWSIPIILILLQTQTEATAKFQCQLQISSPTDYHIPFIPFQDRKRSKLCKLFFCIYCKKIKSNLKHSLLWRKYQIQQQKRHAH